VIEILTTPLAPLSLLALIFATTIYMNLSRRLGAVTKMRPYYRIFVVAISFLVIALLSFIIRNAAYLAADEAPPWLLLPEFSLLFFHVPLFIGTAINIALVWKYWSWLLSETK
jgi:hypothetical protein